MTRAPRIGCNRRTGEQKHEDIEDRRGAGLRPAFVEVSNVRYKQPMTFQLLVSEISYLHNPREARARRSVISSRSPVLLLVRATLEVVVTS
jgi:hypothetical protein